MQNCAWIWLHKFSCMCLCQSLLQSSFPFLPFLNQFSGLCLVARYLCHSVSMSPKNPKLWISRGIHPVSLPEPLLLETSVGSPP